MPIAYSYVRFSTPEQMLGDSQRRQLDMALDYCARNGLELSNRSFRDLGISGFKGKSRPSLQELLDCIKMGIIKPGDYILIETFDRLSRQGVDATHQLIRTILLSKVVVVSLQDNLVLTESSLNNTADIIRIAIAADLANQESQRKSIRVKAARDNARRLAAEGKPSLISTNLPFWLSLDGKKIVINEDKAALVNRIFDMSKDGHGFTRIVTTLNRENIPAPKATLWAKSTISRLLSNRAVLGELQPYIMEGDRRVKDTKTGVITNYYPQVVSDEKFLAVQVAKKDRRTYQSGNRSKKLVFSNVLQQFAKCGKCGSTMEFVDKGKPPKGGQYLTCSLAKRGGACKQNKHFKYQTIERSLYNLFFDGTISFEKSDSGQKANLLNQLEYQLDNLKKGYSSFLESGVDFTMKEVIAAAKKQEASIKELEIKVQDLRWEVTSSDLDDVQFTVENLKKLMDNVKENFQLRSKFNLALIKKFGTCSIQEIQGYIRINLGDDGATFISPDSKWLIPFYTGYLPMPMIASGSKLATSIDGEEMKKQIYKFFDFMNEVFPDTKDSFQANKIKCLNAVNQYVSNGML